MRKTVLAGMAAALLLAGGPALADVKAGVDAWATGDYRKAVEEWRPLALAGDPDAQFNLAQAYKLGRGVPLDPALAESWFQKAALQGHVQAQDNYGLALYQDDKKQDAVPWLEKSVARDEPRAELVLGTMLFNGDGIGRDYPRAYALMTRAQQHGLKSAAETLAQMDQYISAADREKGTALAQRYEAQARTAHLEPAGSDRTVTAVRPTDLPPSRVADAMPPKGEAPGVRAGRGASPHAPRDAAPLRGERVVADGHGERDGASSAGRETVPARIARDDSRPTRMARDEAPADEASAPPRAARPARAAPARDTAAAAPARSTGGRWRVQLGAFREPGNAHEQWSRVSGRLGGAEPVYEKAGAVTRLQAGPYASRGEAERACAAAHVPCVVVGR